jgi:hypothetical protein
MSQAIVRQALELTLSTWAAAQSPAIPVAYENVEFTPPAGRYVRAFLLPAPTESLDLARVHRRYFGVFQVSLVMPKGTGPAAAEALLASLSAAFPTSAPIVRTNVRVWLTQPMSAAPAIQEPDRYVIPVSAPYEAHVY